MTTSRLLCTLFVALGSLASLRAEASRFAADQTSAKFGVGEYRVERIGKEVTVEAFDATPDRRSMATLKIELDTPEGIVMHLDHEGHRLRLSWGDETGRLAVTDMDTGESAARTIELRKPHRIVQEGDVRLFERYDHEVTFGAIMLEQTLTNLGLQKFAHKQVTPPAAPTAPNLVITPKHPVYPDPGDDGGDGGSLLRTVMRRAYRKREPLHTSDLALPLLQLRYPDHQ